MEKKKEKLKFSEVAPRAALLIFALFLLIYLISVISGSQDFYNESAEKNSLLYFEEDIERGENLAREHYNNLYEIVDRLEYAKNRGDVEAVMESYIGSDKFGDLRYYSQGSSYSANGAEVVLETSGGEYITPLAASNREGCTPVYYDKHTELDCIAFFVPVRGSEFVDGVLSILPARNIIKVSSVINGKASAVAAVTKSGKVLSDAANNDFAITLGNNLYTFIDSITHNKSDSALVSEAISKSEKGALTISTQGANYTVAIAPLSQFDNNVLLVSFSESEGLIATELTYIRHIVNLLVIAILALIVGFVFAMLYKKKTTEAITAAALVDSELDCPNAEQFKLQAKELIQSRRRRYSVASLTVKNFAYVKEQLGESGAVDFLRAIADIIANLSNHEECYGYSGDGRFHVLMINANSHSVSDKISLIETLTNRNDLLSERGMKIKISAGVYNVISSGRRSVQEMIDCANLAAEHANDNIKSNYTLYSEEVRTEIARNEKIEAMMESALLNREFRLFLQPKYDPKHDCIHSAEALVRWFDTRRGEYMFPGEFIPLFESNGFIVKLDHFVYIEVLEYLSGAAERGEKVVPIAVNVSRVTATSPDFINFYVGNKKKYGIPDGFVTLELTESFAMESYDKISSIIRDLHNGGLRCSIDDFGSGYSSFSILKQIDFDELKLDSVFMKRGIDVRRDDKLLQTIIDLAKFMGMSVVQEGVETKELFDKVVAMGCDVIQGYYYAKAISLEEFKIFINTNTSIKYKSMVK